MPDLLIRGISSRLKRQIEQRARKNHRSTSDEAKALIRTALSKQSQEHKLGTELFNLLPMKYRGDDLIFEIPGVPRKPPDLT